MNHGELQPQPRTKKAVAIPRILRSQSLRYNIEHGRAVELYGLWEMRALTGFYIAGVAIKPGDTFSIPGNEAVELAYRGQAEFTDAKLAREQEVFEEAKKLGLDKPALLDPEKFRRR